MLDRVQESVPGGVRRPRRAALDRVDDAVEEVAHPNLVRREQEDRDGERSQDDEVDGAVDRDDAQHDAVAQRLSAKRQLDLVAGRRRLARGIRRRRERDPRVAADAAVPADAVLLPRDRRRPRAAAEPRRCRSAHGRARRRPAAPSGSADGNGAASAFPGGRCTSAGMLEEIRWTSAKHAAAC